MNNIKKSQLSKWWLFSILIVIGLFYLNFLIYEHLENPNELGDSFGFVSALFTGLAFAALIISIRQQNIDIRNQLKEIENQTAALNLQSQELANQKAEMQQQNKTLILQRFENTYFNLLSAHVQIIAGVQFNHELGRIALKKCFESQLTYYTQNQTDRKAINQAFIRVLRESIELKHYFDNILSIIKFVDEYPFTHKSEYGSVDFKTKYISIYKSQFSRIELVWLYYYYLSDEGQQYHVLLNRYNFFERLDKESLVRKEHYDLLDVKE